MCCVVSWHSNGCPHCPFINPPVPCVVLCHGTVTAAPRRKIFCGSWKLCRRLSSTFTGLTKCLLNTSASGFRQCPTRWSKLLLQGLSVRLSVRLSPCLYVCLSVCLYLYLSRLSLSWSVCLSVSLSLCLCLSVCLSVRLSVGMFLSKVV